MAYTDDRNHTHSLNLIECSETQLDANGQINSIHYQWITNFTLTSYNVDLLANQGGRLRWKIENEGFNVQKNSELNLTMLTAKTPMPAKFSTCCSNWPVSFSN